MGGGGYGGSGAYGGSDGSHSGGESPGGTSSGYNSEANGALAAAIAALNTSEGVVPTLQGIVPDSGLSVLATQPTVDDSYNPASYDPSMTEDRSLDTTRPDSSTVSGAIQNYVTDTSVREQLNNFLKAAAIVANPVGAAVSYGVNAAMTAASTSIQNAAAEGNESAKAAVGIMSALGLVNSVANDVRNIAGLPGEVASYARAPTTPLGALSYLSRALSVPDRVSSLTRSANNLGGLSASVANAARSGLAGIQGPSNSPDGSSGRSPTSLAWNDQRTPNRGA
jgi:hypothetical protein